MKSIYIVSTGSGMEYVIQGIFADKEIANRFSEVFTDAIINEEFLYTEFPKLYKFECTMNLKTGKVIEIKECKPSVNPILLTLDGKTLYAVGETAAEAQYNAESYYNRLQTESSN